MYLFLVKTTEMRLNICLLIFWMWRMKAGKFRFWANEEEFPCWWFARERSIQGSIMSERQNTKKWQIWREQIETVLFSPWDLSFLLANLLFENFDLCTRAVWLLKATFLGAVHLNFATVSPSPSVLMTWTATGVYIRTIWSGDQCLKVFKFVFPLNQNTGGKKV